MKTLKITFLLLAVLLLTVSGQSSDSAVENDVKSNTTNVDLMAHTKAKVKVPSNGLNDNNRG